jgi:hypothetical protein
MSTTHDLLLGIVDSIEYRPGWRVGLSNNDDGHLELQIISLGYDTHHPEQGEHYRVLHPFLVPSASYNRESWIRWVLDCYIQVETHEACEFLRVDGKQPYAPNHGPGWAQYMIREVSRVEDAETTWRGERREGSQS